MKLSLISILNEISRWKKEGYKDKNPYEIAKEIFRDTDSQYWIHFTNTPNKIGINPRSDFGLANPFGYYGFPLNSRSLEQLKRDQGVAGIYAANEKYLVIFKPRAGANIVDWDEVDHIAERIDQEYGPSKKVQSMITKELMRRGIDGVISKNFSMSQDIESEIVIFKPSDVKILDIKINTLLDDARAGEKERELEERPFLKKYKDFERDSAPQGMTPEKIERSVRKKHEYHNLASPLRYYKNRSRNKRKGIHSREDLYDYSYEDLDF